MVPQSAKQSVVTERHGYPLMTSLSSKLSQYPTEIRSISYHVFFVGSDGIILLGLLILLKHLLVLEVRFSKWPRRSKEK